MTRSDLDELELWAAACAIGERSEGFKAQMAGREAIAATHIGREFAFMLVIARIQEMRQPKGAPQ